ncbi:regulatory LuxR family protein [Kitasatospora atroaurantiaca]|uniref:Regulatory LuxR family protein n=1 Tax=Kitasatospora atroaurantiaca TaxID=285545 RepID=A0A561ESA5_9ACTN|nr:regulatory LuxR family protein [Kitasatospora atroaurantiaca]
MAVASDVPLDEAVAPLPGEVARQLYLAILAAGGRVPISDPAVADRRTVDELLGIGLLTRTDISYCAVSPRAVSGRLATELRATATRLLVRAESLPAMLDGLTKAYDDTPRPADRSGPVELVHDRAEIQHRIARLLSDCKEEMLTAQPGPRPAHGLAIALQQDLPFLQRGGVLRTLYRPTALDEPATVAYAATVTEHGGRVRILDEPFPKMMLFDRTVAVIPAGEDRLSASFVEDRTMVDHLVSSFERDWRRADSVAWGSSEEGRSRVPERVGRLLAQGFTQRAVATRLGLSERTVAGHISRLRERYGAQTLFQLGWLMRGGRGE